jgi:ABC-type glycerol-3-phosphate transport system substrate-binding protein
MDADGTRAASTRRAVLGAGAAGAGAWLAACGGGAGQAPAATQTGPATIDLWMNADPVFEDLFNQELIPRYKPEAPQVTVNLVPVPGGWDAHYEKLLTANAAGTPPDLDRGKEFWAPTWARWA